MENSIEFHEILHGIFNGIFHGILNGIGKFNKLTERFSPG
jgi:hypothetical protein